MPPLGLAGPARGGQAYGVRPSPLTAAIVALWGCGAGLEAVHESDVRFEHCYRLDMDSAAAPSHRLHCWRDWTRLYAYGQPRHRIEYVRRRMIALESGDMRLVTVHTGPSRRQRIFAETGGAPQPAGGPIAAPAPTSAHKPPPATAPAATVAPPPPAGPPAPGSACATNCDKAWNTCASECGADAERCATCREDYRGCMRRCYE